MIALSRWLKWKQAWLYILWKNQNMPRDQNSNSPNKPQSQPDVSTSRDNNPNGEDNQNTAGDNLSN